MPEQLKRFIKVDFDYDKCYRKFERDIVYSLAPSLDEIGEHYTYCVNCVEIEEEPKKRPVREKKTKAFGLSPTKTTKNLHSLEIDKRTLRKTERIHQLNTSVSEEWLTKLTNIAYEERLNYNEVSEQALVSLRKCQKIYEKTKSV